MCLQGSDPEDSISFKDAYESYQAFCVSEGHRKPYPKKEFREILEGEGYAVKNCTQACESGSGVWVKECGSGRGVMVFGDWGIIPAGLGWSPILCNHVLLTIWIDKSMGKEGIFRI